MTNGVSNECSKGLYLSDCCDMSGNDPEEAESAELEDRLMEDWRNGECMFVICGFGVR